MASKMFPFITCTWNPLGGECKHGCRYCWARALAKKYDMKKYQGEPRLYQRELEREFKPGDFVFVCDMLDLFGEWVPSDLIKVILGKVAHSPATFLLLTKNPWRYFDLLDFLPANAVLGCTIESDRNFPALSKAPPQFDRIYWMQKLQDIIAGHRVFFSKLFVSIEPILDFSPIFYGAVSYGIKPWAVAVGYDNYANHLPEPPLEKSLELIRRLENAGSTVFCKTLREAWNV